MGKWPAILGHEGAGIIRRLGTKMDNKELRVGQPVLLTFSTCLECRFCKSGTRGTCPRMTDVNFAGERLTDGSSPVTLATSNDDDEPRKHVRGQFFGQSSFSHMSIVREQSIVPFESSMEALPFLAPLSCGYNTGASTVFNILKPIPGSSIAIVGTGAVGFAALMAAKSAGLASIIAVDIVDVKLETAKELGASHVVNTWQSRIPLTDAIHKVLPNGVDYIVETTGMKSSIEQSIAALGHGGTIALVGTPHAGESLSIDSLDVFLACKKIVGVIAGASDPRKSIPRLVELHTEGKFPVEKLGKIYPVTELDAALEDLEAGRVIKPIISWK